LFNLVAMWRQIGVQKWISIDKYIHFISLFVLSKVATRTEIVAIVDTTVFDIETHFTIVIIISKENIQRQ
jgi:hypothetical protein